MPTINSINLEFVVSTRHSRYSYNESDLTKNLVVIPHFKTHSVSVYFDNDRIGYASWKDKQFVFNCLKHFKSKRYLIDEWNIVCHKPYYIVIKCNINDW